jgi:hypothetical protein
MQREFSPAFAESQKRLSHKISNADFNFCMHFDQGASDGLAIWTGNASQTTQSKTSSDSSHLDLSVPVSMVIVSSSPKRGPHRGQTNGLKSGPSMGLPFHKFMRDYSLALNPGDLSPSISMGENRSQFRKIR